MSELNWTDYVAIAFGSVGAITGIAGIWVSIVSYRKANSIKSLDLRLELRKDVTGFQLTLKELKELIPYADKSRINTVAATGRSQSGDMEIWKIELEKDKQTMDKLFQESSQLKGDFHNLNHKELETKLVKVHEHQTKVNLLLDKYKEAVEQDRDTSKQIAAAHQARLSR